MFSSLTQEEFSKVFKKDLKKELERRKRNMSSAIHIVDSYVLHTIIDSLYVE